MQIPHEEARELIHLAADEMLKPDQKAILDLHLASCAECRNYSNSLHQMEAILNPLLRRQWAQQPIPLSIDTFLSRTNNKSSSYILVATRIAAVSVVFMAFLFSAWQFALSKPSMMNSIPASVPPIPRPSSTAQFVSTKTMATSCEEVNYVVQANDTLGNIADRFSTSKKDIMIANNMKSEIVIRGMKVIIPVCNLTPTGTVNSSTITFTPILRTIVPTPGG